MQTTLLRSTKFAWFLPFACVAALSLGAGCDEAETEVDGPTTEPARPPVVLVHGAWMGGWAWDDVVPRFEEAGYATHVVDLPSHGDDPTSPQTVTLAGYRDTVVAVLDSLDEPAILVGHSMGGIVISEVAEARPSAIDTLVYVAAFLPKNGDSLLGLAGTDTGSQAGPHLIMNQDGTVSFESSAIGYIFCADCAADDLARIVDRTRPEAIGPLTTPVAITDSAFGTVRRVYVRTEHDLAISVGAQDAMVAARGVDDVRSLATSHSPFFSKPDELVAAIREMTEDETP